MKKDILKIAGVKSEKEFYKKYPTEEAFMKAHGKAFKKAAIGASVVKKQLTQLTDFANPPQAQVGANLQYPYVQYNPSNPTSNINPYGGGTLNNATYDSQTGMIGSTTGQVSMADTQKLGLNNSGTKSINDTSKNLDANKIQAGVQMTSTIGSNIQKVSKAIQDKKKAKQLKALAPVIVQASGLRSERTKFKDVRPEDVAFATQEMGQKYGTSYGNQFLQGKDGISVGGNPTEIQNMYNPGNLYVDLGYEPLDDSNIKQYRKGGYIPKAQDGGGGGVPMAAIQEGVNLAGDLVSGIISIGTNRINKQNEKMLGQAAFQSGMQDMQQNQYSGFMENGGEVGLKYLSNDWQPQVIASFGEHKLKDLLRPPHDADMLRAGGHLKNYTAPSAAAMSTERPEMAMGGNLKTTWGGYAEPISQNPYLPGSGETVMFRGKSHEESDGNGHTGIGVKYGQGAHDSYTDYAEYGTRQADADVEVERGEPAVELPDAETGGESMVVYGNMPIPSYGVSELGDKKAKGKKFKSYANDLSKIEARQNKIIDKGTEILDSVDSDSPYDMLKFNAAKAMVEGGNMKLKEIAAKKTTLAGIQNAILDTAEEMGLESDSLAKGKIKPVKNSDMAKFGAKMETAQIGINQPLTPILPMSTYYRIDPKTDFKIETAPQIKEMLKQEAEKQATPKGKSAKKATVAKAPERPKPITSIDRIGKSTKDMNVISDVNVKVPDYAKNLEIDPLIPAKDKFDWMDIVRQAQPYLIPSNQEPFDYRQITPEMLALATNQLEPVQAQTFQPLLEQPYTVSLQDQLNEIQAGVNASKRLIGNNPSALAAIDAQASAAKNQVLAQQLRLNQELQMGAYNRNRDFLNKSTLQNFEILDRQYTRQSQAKSATKAQAQAALSSIADKMAKQKLENRTLGVYENMYNYRFGPKGRAYNVNAPYEFDTRMASMSTQEIEDLLAKRKASEKKNTAKNGSIVKAIKNL